MTETHHKLALVIKRDVITHINDDWLESASGMAGSRHLNAAVNCLSLCTHTHTHSTHILASCYKLVLFSVAWGKMSQDAPDLNTSQRRAKISFSWFQLIKIMGGLLWWLSGKEYTCQRQEKWVLSLGWEDSTCLRATKPMHHNYWACALEPVSHNYWRPGSPCSRKSTTRRSLCTTTRE